MSRAVVSVLLLLTGCCHCQDDFLNDTFPDGFRWGVATAAYQIEGAWNLEGKGVNIWDTRCHDTEAIENGDTGDVACDSYHKIPDDVAMLTYLGVNFYRFSLSWSRILPDGTTTTINELGIAYYNRLIDAILAAGITPMVTLYHWDLPQPLQDVGGWENEDLVQYFNDYANVCFQRFGDRVKHWLTFNEPYVFTYLGYGTGGMAPGIVQPATAPYNAAHTVILSHAAAYHTYNDNYRPTQNGLISITLDSDWKEPLDPSNPIDVEAAERAMQFKLGWFAHPIYVNGDYPEVMKTMIGEKSDAQGYPESRLSAFTDEEKTRIQGTHDFFGLNHYTTQLCTHQDTPIEVPSYDNDKEVGESTDPSWPTSGSSWLRVVPWGMRKLLNWVRTNYNNPQIFITENGMSDRNATLQDDHRIYYYRNYINEALKATVLDGVDLRAYTAWSVMDNFEWNAGYSEKFGLHHVDFNDPNRPRTPKASANFYRQLIVDNGFPPTKDSKHK